MIDGRRNFMAQQKQHKQLILNDSKNIFTCLFQQIQRLQPNFITESRRTFIHTKHNRKSKSKNIFTHTGKTTHTTRFMTDLSRNLLAQS